VNSITLTSGRSDWGKGKAIGAIPPGVNQLREAKGGHDPYPSPAGQEVPTLVAQVSGLHRERNAHPEQGDSGECLGLLGWCTPIEAGQSPRG